MEEKILAELVQLKWISLALFIAVVIYILFHVVAISLKLRNSNSQALLLMRDNYLAELALLEIKGDYDALLEKSEEMLQSFPNDLMANWYNALGNRQTGQLGAALSALGRIQSINKAWSADAVEELMADIKSEMKGPQASQS